MTLPQPRRRALVLVVDDEAPMLEVYEELLERLGVDALADSDPRVTARRLQGRERFDLVLLDLRLPDLDGLELLRRIRRLHGPVPVIVVTGYPSRESAEACRALGVRHYVRKPFDPDGLARLVRAELAATERARAGA